MSFIVLDDKEWCKGIYSNGKLYYNQFPNDLDRTWKFAAYLNDHDIQYAQLFCEGKELDDVCPDALKNDWTLYNKKLEAFVKSFIEAKISLHDNCIYDLIPEQFLLEFCNLKSKIIDSVFENNKKPINYDFSLKLEKILHNIKNQSLNLDFTELHNQRYDVRVREFLKNSESWSPNIDFNQFGTKTGRLTTRPKTFPILNLKADYRKIIKPSNDFFLEMDFNAAELRVLIALSGQSQPKGDIHEWNAQRLGLTREEAKKQVFAWLYGSSHVDASKFEEVFQTKSVLEKYFDGKKVTNYFGREIEADPFHALNYIVQSTTSDMVLRQIIKASECLAGKKTRIGFIVHDSMVTDVADSESAICNSLAKVFSNCEFGVFPISISIGKNYGTLKEIKEWT